MDATQETKKKSKIRRGHEIMTTTLTRCNCYGLIRALPKQQRLAFETSPNSTTGQNAGVLINGEERGSALERSATTLEDLDLHGVNT